MSKAMLHKTKLEEFKAFLDGEGIAHRPGRGDWQVLQVCKDGKHWNCVYERLDMPEHYTTDMHLDPLVVKFCRQRKDRREVGGSEHNEPWEYTGIGYTDSGSKYHEVRDSKGNQVIGECCTTEDLLRRIVACVNACAGMNDEDLVALAEGRFHPLDTEKHSRAGLVKLLGVQNFMLTALKAQVISESRAVLKQQRDKLLAALKARVELDDGDRHDFAEVDAESRAIIAEVEAN